MLCRLRGTAGHRTAEIIAGNPDPQDSVADLYDRVNGGVDDGADLADCVNAMTSPGVAPSSLVPMYQIPTLSPITGLAAARALNPLEHATFCPDEEAMLAAVESGTPVYFGIIVTNQFNPDSGGNIGPYGGRTEGGHAVLAIGVKPTPHGHAYRVRNSWGKNWGIGGDCWLDSSWAQPSVYGAFAMEGDPRPNKQASLNTVGSVPTPSGTGDTVLAAYFFPTTPTQSQLAVALAGSASSSLRLVTWELSDKPLASALSLAASSGKSVAAVLNLTGGTSVAQRVLARQLIASGGSVWSAIFPEKIANNFLEADGKYTLKGNSYWSPTAIQQGTYLLAISGTPTATTCIATFNTLVASGTRTLSLPEPQRDRQCAGPDCPNGTCPINSVTPPTPREVQLDVGPIHWIWKSQRQGAAWQAAPQGPLRRLIARFRARRAR